MPDEYEEISLAPVQRSWRAGHPPPAYPPPPSYGPEPYGMHPSAYPTVPLPPGSLAPMAMPNDAGATGPQRSQRTVIVRPRGSIRAGLAILLSGVVVGGVFGVVTRNQANAAVAAAEAPADPAPPPPAPMHEGPGKDGSGPTGVVPPSAAVVVPPTKEGAKGDAKKGGARHGHSSTPRTAAPKKEKDDGWTVASAVGTNEAKDQAAPPKADKPEPKADKPEPKADKPEKTDKGEKADKGEKNDAAPKKPPAAGGKPPDDVDRVLKAAMGATENTL